MMASSKAPVTAAVRALRAARVEFTDHLYEYEPRGGTRVSARELGVEEHLVVKTLIMEDAEARPLVVLMHGDLEVSTKKLARCIGTKSVVACAPEVAQRHSGYLVGGTSPLGTRRRMPVYMERTISALPRIYLNGGHRGYLVGLDPADLLRVLTPILVDVGIAAS